MKRIEEKIKRIWGVDIHQVENDASKYGAQRNDAWVRNEILGTVQVADVKKAEKQGAIVYVAEEGISPTGRNGSWRIKSDWFVDKETGDKRAGVSLAYLKWIKKC